MEQFWATLIAATLRHLSKARRGEDRFALAVYYLKCVAVELQRANKYTLASQARALRARIETDGALNPVYRELLVNFPYLRDCVPSQVTPPSNTGVKSPVQSDLEAYIANGS